MFDYDWSTEVLPIIQQYTDSSLLKGAIIFLISISLVSYAARGVISVFFRRD